MPVQSIRSHACEPLGRDRRHGPAAMAAALCLQGCAQRGAPSYEIFGAYFPLWLLSALVGVAGGLIAHRLLIATGWAQIVPLHLLVCVSVGLTVAVLFWLSGTGPLP